MVPQGTLLHTVQHDVRARFLDTLRATHFGMQTGMHIAAHKPAHKAVHMVAHHTTHALMYYLVHCPVHGNKAPHRLMHCAAK